MEGPADRRIVMTGAVATAEADINATPVRVWQALTDPEQIRRYMFGSQVETDWQPGHPIVWRGEYQGRRFEDRGRVLEVHPLRRLKVTHFSPLSGKPDLPANYHTVTYDLELRDGHTHVSLSQDNNADEAEVEHSTANWQQMLDGLKAMVENS
jgi:uncharacterized protein YndB with AHSA1/START domain